MIDTSDLKVTIADVTAILDNRGIKFHLTGGLASSFYGEPRFTQDIDIVVRAILGDSLNQLIQDLSQKFIVEPDAIKEAARPEGIFQALHEETMIKVDFHVGEAIKGELSRSKREEILSEVFVPLVSREDAILSKLLWISKGSSKSRHDVRGMLSRSGEIDFEYLNTQASELGVNGIFEELKAEANGDKIP